jgi:hypothetical protein
MIDPSVLYTRLVSPRITPTYIISYLIVRSYFYDYTIIRIVRIYVFTVISYYMANTMARPWDSVPHIEPIGKNYIMYIIYNISPR